LRFEVQAAAVGKKVSLIVACDENRLIGRDGDLPWRLPNDLKHFKTLTLGKTILMGRKTWDSLGRPLPQRENWVLTRDPAFAASGCRVFRRLEDALSAHTAGELMVIGGAELYRQTLPHAQRLYLTQVHAHERGDTWFPDLSGEGFREILREDHPSDERHAYAYSFLVLER
jgi:dihydrofolate reductase